MSNVGSTRESCPLRPCATQTASSADVEARRGRRQRDRPRDPLAAASIRISVRSSRFPTQREPAPEARGPGRAPTGIVATTLFVSGSMAATELGGTVSAVPRREGGARHRQPSRGAFGRPRGRPPGYAAGARPAPGCRSGPSRRTRARRPGAGWRPRARAAPGPARVRARRRGAARRLVGGQRLGLPARPVEREHELRPRPFAVWLLGDERLELRDQRGVPAEREVGVDPLFQGVEPLLLEPAIAVATNGSVDRSASGVSRQRSSASPAVRARSSSSAACASARSSKRSRSSAPARRRARSRARSCAASARHPGPCAARQRRPGAPSARSRRRVAPKLVDQPLRRHDAVRVQQQEREHGTLLPRPEVDADAVGRPRAGRAGGTAASERPPTAASAGPERSSPDFRRGLAALWLRLQSDHTP